MFTLPYWFHPVAYTILACYVCFTIVICYLWKHGLRNSVLELTSVADTLLEHRDIELRDAKLAAMLNLTQDELLTELEQNDRLSLVGRKISSVIATLKATFPIKYDR